MQLLDRVLVKLGHGLGLPSRYTPLKKIGAGAEGEVWLGVDEVTQSMVALKFISRGAPAWKLDMARREFSMLAQLGPGHINIVRALEVVLTSKYLVLITEYVAGGSLSDYLARHSMCEEVACYFFRQLLDAISFCHTRRIVYRDIKPANILITGTQPPFLKLCDFGLADSWEGRPGPCFKSLVGTPGYMAPEIMSSFFTGAAELARRSKEAAALARRSKDAAKSQQATTAATAVKCQQPPQQAGTALAGAAAVAAATATHTLKPCSSGITPAAADKADKAAVKKGESASCTSGLSSCTSGLKRSASSCSMQRSASATRLAELAAAASKAAAAVPGGSNISRSLAAVAAAVGLPDAAAEAELEVVPTYDGEKADVYSLGVLLVVMMLRRMPWNYDSYADRLPVLKAMKALHTTAVVHKVSWRTSTSKANTLSPQLAAMLDGMLEPNPDKRFTLQQVAECEWLQLPLPPKLQCALEVVTEQQELREVHHIAAMADATEAADSSSCSADTAAAAAAAAAAIKQQLDEMITAAQTVGKGYKLVSRLILAESLQRRQQQPQQQTHVPEAEQPLEVKDSASDYCTAAIITAQVSTEGQAAGDGKGGVAAPAVDVSVKVA